MQQDSRGAPSLRALRVAQRPGTSVRPLLNTENSAMSAASARMLPEVVVMRSTS